MDWGNTGTQRGGLRTLCSVDFTSLERIKNLYIRHILDIKSFGCWKYGHYRDRLSGLSFFSFSSLALIHLAEQPIRGISVTTNSHSHRCSLTPQTDQWQSFLRHSVKSPINIHIVYCFFVEHLGLCLRWEPGELWHGATRSDFLMNLSTGLLTEECVLMVQISKQAALVIWDCGALPKTDWHRVLTWLKQNVFTLNPQSISFL